MCFTIVSSCRRCNLTAYNSLGDQFPSNRSLLFQH
jgi:hypothetical protein